MTGDTSIDLAIGGGLMPWLIALINQSTWSPRTRGLVAFLLCVGAAAMLAAWHGTLTWSNWRDTAIALTGSAMVMYHALWKPSGLVPEFERATTLSGDATESPASEPGDEPVS